MSILQSDIFDKLCAKIDRDFNCKKLFKCNVCCPVYIFKEVEKLLGKGQRLEHAYKKVTEKAIPHEEGRAIIRDRVCPNGVFEHYLKEE